MFSYFDCKMLHNIHGVAHLRNTYVTSFNSYLHFNRKFFNLTENNIFCNKKVRHKRVKYQFIFGGTFYNEFFPTY